MYTSRRTFLGACGAGAATAPWLSGQGQASQRRVGVTDWNIQQTGKLEALDFAAAARALADIGYAGFIVLETPAPSGSIEADMRRNLAFVRELIRKTV